jgi:hypothetical protein
MDQNQYIIETIVRMLLDTSGATVSLVDKVWETWTPEQRKYFADKAYDIATEKMPSIIGRVFSEARGNQYSDMLSSSIRHRLDVAFKSGKISDQIDSLIEREVSYWRGRVQTDVESAVEKLVNQALRVSMGRVDLDDIMSYVKKEKGGA